MTVVPLVKALHRRRPQWSILVSTVTETGREAVEQRLNGIATHCYLPLDFPWAVETFVTRLQPMAFLFVETELWPNVLRGMKRHGVPVYLINGRLSSRSFRRYRWIKRFMSDVLSCVDLYLMQSERDARRIRELGASPDRIHCTGNMKFDQEVPQSSPSGRPVTRAALGLKDHEPLLVAGSTHPHEEEELVECYRRLYQTVPESVLLLAPRHIERVDRVEEMLLARGMVPIRRSRLEEESAGTSPSDIPRVIILDTRGELARAYALARVAFVGGTLVPVGGHNLLEPAQWGKPVLFGPHTDHCADIARRLVNEGGGIQVQGPEELFAELQNLFADERECQRRGAAGLRVVEANRGVVQRNLDLLLSHLENQDSHPATTPLSPLSVQSGAGR